jgi:nucleoside-diphosphate-sugar epimerase/predicted dehydrogenase
MQGAKLRAALVGCGRISAYHVAAIQALADAEIVAVCDLREQLASDLASQNGIPAVFTDAAAMLQATRPDVVHIVTPPQSHVALATIAAEHGAHMYIEKPFAAGSAEAAAIMAAASAAGVMVCAGHSRVFDPSFRAALQRVDDGEIGQLLSVRAEQGFTYEPGARSATIPWDHTYDWGIFENLMPHPLSIICHLLREPGDPQVAALVTGRVREAAVEEIRVQIPAANAIGEVSLSLASPECNRLELVGTLGRINVDFDAMTVLASSENGLPTAVNRFGGNFVTAAKLADASLGVAYGLASGRIKRYMGIRALIAEFYRAVREDAPPPVSPEDALLNVRLMEQIREACRQVAKQRTQRVSAAGGTSSPRVLVTGASGFLGGRLVERLAQDGVAVRATTRLISRTRELPGVEWVECDLTRQDDVRRAVAGMHSIYHCAGMVGPPGSLEDYERANVGATMELAHAAREAWVDRLVYLSSLSVYGPPESGDGVVEETDGYDDRASDRGVYTQTKVRAEAALLEYARQNDAPRVTVLRPGTIYGPGAPLPVGLFELPSSHRRPFIAGSGHVPVALTYVDNVIDAMLAAAERDTPTGSVYNVVDSADVDQATVCHDVRRLSHGRIRPVIVPYGAVWAMMLGVDLLSLARHRKLGTARYRLKRTLAPMRFPSTRARAELGWKPRVELAEGLSNVLRG